MTLRLLQLCLVFCLFSFLFPAFSSAKQGGRPVYNVGTVTDGTTVTDLATFDLFQKELQLLAEGEFLLNFPKAMTLSGKDTAEGAGKALEQLFANPDVDLVLTLGHIGSNMVFRLGDIPKPVVAPFVAGSVSRDRSSAVEGRSGVKNLAYIETKIFADREVINFKKIVPFRNLAILLDQRIIRELPEVEKYAKRLANEHSISVTLVPGNSSVQETLDAVPVDTDAVMVGPLYSFSDADYEEFSQGLIARGLPSYSIWSRKQVESGLLAGEVSKDMEVNLARRAAVAAQSILLGEKADSLTVNFSRGRELTLNMATARALDIYPGLVTLVGANLLNEQRTDIKRHLNLQQAVNDALKANLDLSSSQLTVKAGEYSVSEARSPLLPQIGIGTGYRTIDQDRADLSMGSSPENAWTGTITGSQQIYSERSWAAYTVEEHNQTGRRMDYETVRLDVMYQASTAYLQVLQAKTIEQLFKDNLKLTQANLDRASIRLSTGAAGPDEVYRWETQFARDKIDVLRRESATLDAITAVNRILNRPLQELFIAEETDLADPLLMVGGKFFYHLTTNPKYFSAFRGFAVEEALAGRPELKFFDAAIEAKLRIKTAAGRDRWLPDFSVEGSVDQYLSENGAGQRGDYQDGLDDTDWQVGVFARLPLFEGGRKSATLNRNRKELAGLLIDRQAAADRISQDTLVSLNRTRASYPGINLSRDAADSARRNLNLITDSYVQGIKSIIELLDAQNQALSADQAAANAVYSFLIDLMGVQRSMGEFITFQPQQQRDAWLERVEKYFAQPSEPVATGKQ